MNRTELVGGVHDGMRVDFDTASEVLAVATFTRSADGGVDATIAVHRGITTDDHERVGAAALDLALNFPEGAQP